MATTGWLVRCLAIGKLLYTIIITQKITAIVIRHNSIKTHGDDIAERNDIVIEVFLFTRNYVVFITTSVQP